MSNQIQVVDRAAPALLMQSESMDKLERLADLMASGKATVPNHLKNSKGDCFAIALQSMQWGMNPFAVAQKTHLINGVLGYEAQLVAAVINSSGVVTDRFNFEWFGDWEKIVGKFKEIECKDKKDDLGHPKKYRVPGWNIADENGLGVRVWATLRGETSPRELTVLMTQARTRNSTLWTDDPKQQIAYLAEKKWARLFAPDVIMGVYTPDELELVGKEVFMGDAEVTPPAPPPPPAPYPQADFESNLDKWAKVVASKRKNLGDLVAMVNSKANAQLTEEQVEALNQAVKTLSEAIVDVQPKEKADGVMSFAQVADAIEKSTDELTLDLARGLVPAVNNHEMETELYSKCAQKFNKIKQAS